MKTSPRVLSVLVLLFFGFCYFAGAAAAQTVPDDFLTIQAAVDAAGDGATIFIKKGTYNENVVVNNKTNLSIIGKGKPIIDGGNGTALTITNSANAFITGIICRNSATGGIVIDDCTGINISKCSVIDTTGDGIEVNDSNDVDIDKCTISNPTGRGISFSFDERDTTDASSVTKCKITNAGGDGIHIHGSNNLVEKCKIENSNGNGISFDTDAGATTNQILKNKISGTGVNGILLAGTNNSITQNNITNAGNEGIRVLGSNHTIHQNKIKNSDDDGIDVNGTAVNITITQNNISVGDGDGIDVDEDSGGHEINSNKCTKFADNGFEIDSQNNVLTNNKASGNGGFDLQDGNGAAGFNTYSGNKFKTSNIPI